MKLWRGFAVMAVCLLMTLAVPAGQADGRDIYWSAEEYMRAHPGQLPVIARFSSLVSGAPARLTVEQDRPLQIWILYPGVQISDYWRRSVASFTSRMDEIGIRYNISSYFTRPGDNELQMQSQFIERALQEGPDFLIFTLDALRHRGLINRIIGRGETKLILQNITTPIKSFEARAPFLYVGFDHVEGTRMIARHYKEKWPDGARYALLFGERGYVSTRRGDTFLQEMAERPDIELVDAYFVPYNHEIAYESVKELLARHNDLDFIYASSTDIARGAVDALREAGRLDQVMVNGWGGGAYELEAIERGDLSFTVMRMNDDNGVAMAEAMRLYLEGHKEYVPHIYAGGFRLVDKNTPEDLLAEWMSYAFRYSQ